MKLSLIAALSLDGHIAQSEHQKSLDWTSKADLQFFIEKTKELGVVIMGRKTFETIGRPLKGRLLVVLTSNPDAYQDRHAEGELEFTSLAPKALVESLAKRGFETAAIAGGAKVYGDFLREGLVDECFLTVEPILFGNGVKFAKDIEPAKMSLISVSELGEGSVVLHYKI